MGRSRGGLTTKIHALVDADGRPVRLMLTTWSRGRTSLLPGDSPATALHEAISWTAKRGRVEPCGNPMSRRRSPSHS